MVVRKYELMLLTNKQGDPSTNPLKDMEALNLDSEPQTMGSAIAIIHHLLKNDDSVKGLVLKKKD